MRLRYAWRLLSTHGFISSQLRDMWMHARHSFASDPFAQVYKSVRPFTMSGEARLHGLYAAVQEVTRRGVPGGVVECGTARGGSAALLGLAVRESGVPRTVWVFDTFEGIPPPTSADPDYDFAAPYTGSFRGDLSEVTALFDRLGIGQSARFIKGRFEDTVPQAQTGPIAVLHIDGDWYSSVKVCLDHFYDFVSPGGIIQIDDYGHWQGARKALDEFMATRGITAELRYVDYTGRQFVKA